MNESQVNQLGELGLNRYEAAVYLALLERGDYAPAGVAQRAEVPRQRIYDILSSLEEKGFCSVKSTRPRMYAAIEPKIALSHYLASRDRELHDELSRMEQGVRSAIAALAPVYEAGARESDPFQYLEIVRTPGRIAQRALEIASTSVSEVNSFVKLPMILDDEQNIRFIHEPLSRGVRYRSIYESEALSHSGVEAFAANCARLGQEIRVCDHLPVKMHAFDGSTALLSLQDPVGGRPSFTAIITHHAGMVEALKITFAALWTNARRYEPPGGAQP